MDKLQALKLFVIYMTLKQKKIFYTGIGLLSSLFTGLNFLTNAVEKKLINDIVPKFFLVEFFETRNLYFLIHLIVILPVLILTFEKKVHFISNYKHLFKGLLIVGGVFIVWDSLKTFAKVWTFNENYILGIFIGNLPLEEYIFFVTVPIACLLIHQSILSYKLFKVRQNDDLLINILIPLLLFFGIFFWTLMYTSTVCLITTSALCFHYVYGEANVRIKTYNTYLFSLIPFILINGILTGGFTNEPIVSYNEGEFLKIRLISIALEDAIYLFHFS
ncbi:lycopene cyclase domain-containing protein [Flavobacterium sp. XS2P14]|uniref:lycopene cyclase domain-containing protein n=1 Tax=Flavobacterium sp. XS2P14 TaxID=3401735 RepID=UPI003AAF3C18